MQRLTIRAVLAAALLGAFFVACNNAPTAPERRSLPHRAHPTHLSGGYSAAFTFESLPKNHGLVTFDASDSDGAVGVYVWAWGDLSADTTTVPTATHTYAASGIYTVTLCVAATVDQCWTPFGVYDSRERSVVVKGAGRPR